MFFVTAGEEFRSRFRTLFQLPPRYCARFPIPNGFAFFWWAGQPFCFPRLHALARFGIGSGETGPAAAES